MTEPVLYQAIQALWNMFLIVLIGIGICALAGIAEDFYRGCMKFWQRFRGK